MTQELPFLLNLTGLALLPHLIKMTNPLHLLTLDINLAIPMKKDLLPEQYLKKTLDLLLEKLTILSFGYILKATLSFWLHHSITGAFLFFSSGCGTELYSKVLISSP